MSISYEKLKKMIAALMPHEYLTDEIVEIRHYEVPFFNWQVNFDPYKNDGELLPWEVLYYDKSERFDPLRYYNFTAGTKWLPVYFSDMRRENELYLLPVAFISVVLQQMKKAVIPCPRDLMDLKRQSDKELADNRYRAPKKQCKNLLPVSDELWLRMQGFLRGKTPLTEEVLARFVIDSVRYVTDKYRMVIWLYPESEYKRAQKIYRKTALASQKKTFAWIKE